MSKKSQTSTKTHSSRLTQEPTSNTQKTMVVLQNSVHNARYLRGIFDNKEKIID